MSTPPRLVLDERGVAVPTRAPGSTAFWTLVLLISMAVFVGTVALTSHRTTYHTPTGGTGVCAQDDQRSGCRG